MIYKKACDVIAKDQKAIIVFTRGEKFEYDPLGNGTTGNWIVNPERLENIDKIIIYMRKGDETVNRIFLGDYTGTQKTEEYRRHQICFSRLEEVGITEANWLDFTSGGSNPVRYISK